MVFNKYIKSKPKPEHCEPFKILIKEERRRRHYIKLWHFPLPIYLGKKLVSIRFIAVVVKKLFKKFARFLLSFLKIKMFK